MTQTLTDALELQMELLIQEHYLYVLDLSFSFFHNNHSLLNHKTESIIQVIMIITCTLCKKQMQFDTCRVRYAHWYHRRCVWHVAHLVRLDGFF